MTSDLRGSSHTPARASTRVSACEQPQKYLITHANKHVNLAMATTTTARLMTTLPAVHGLGGYIRVVGGVIIADAHLLSSYIRGVTAVFSIFLALEAALERKTIDPEFSLLSLPLIPLEIATGVTKK